MSNLTKEETDYLERYRQNLKELPLKNDDIVVIINSLKELEYQDIPPYDYIDILLEEVHPSTTVVMQSFNWNFFKGKKYHHKRTVSQTGLISELFRRMDGVRQSPHPVYTYLAYGPKAEALCQHDGTTCWGEDTPLHSLLEENALWVNIAREFPYGIELLHMAEEKKRVPYRFFKEFSGIADFGDGEQEYSTQFFARPMTPVLEYNWNCAIELVRSRKQVQSFEDFPMTSIRSKDLLNACCECLDNDMLCFLTDPEKFKTALAEGITWE